MCCIIIRAPLDKRFCSYRISVELARGTPKGKDALKWTPPEDVTLFENRYKQPTRTNYRLKVENLSTAVGWQVVHVYFYSPPADGVQLRVERTLVMGCLVGRVACHQGFQCKRALNTGVERLVQDRGGDLRRCTLRKGT